MGFKTEQKKTNRKLSKKQYKKNFQVDLSFSDWKDPLNNQHSENKKDSLSVQGTSRQTKAPQGSVPSPEVAVL